MGYVYWSDVFKDLVEEVWEYVRESEHQLDIHEEVPRDKRELVLDFVEYLKAKYEE